MLVRQGGSLAYARRIGRPRASRSCPRLGKALDSGSKVPSKKGEKEKKSFDFGLASNVGLPDSKGSCCRGPRRELLDAWSLVLYPRERTLPTCGVLINYEIFTLLPQTFPLSRKKLSPYKKRRRIEFLTARFLFE